MLKFGQISSQLNSRSRQFTQNIMLLTNLASMTNKSKKTVLCVQVPELDKTVFRTDNHKPKIYKPESTYY